MTLLLLHAPRSQQARQRSVAANREVRILKNCHTLASRKDAGHFNFRAKSGQPVNGPRSAWLMSHDCAETSLHLFSFCSESHERFNLACNVWRLKFTVWRPPTPTRWSTDPVTSITGIVRPFWTNLRFFFFSGLGIIYENPRPTLIDGCTIKAFLSSWVSRTNQNSFF